jgi:uroporphyrinogen decarboxylase
MNSLERVRTAAKRGGAAQIPVGPYIASWTARWSGIPLSSYCTDGRAMARSQLLAWEKLGQDIIFPDSDNYYLAEGFGCKTKINQNEIPTLLQPAIGEFEQAFNLKIPDPYRDGRMPVILEAIERIHSQVGDEVCIRVPGTGPFSVASSLVGVERFLLEMALIQRGKRESSRAAVEHMLELTTRTLIRFGLAELKAGAHLLQCGDSLASTNVISPEMYRTWVLPRHQQVFQAWKEAGALTLLHICGNTTRILDALAQTGADIIAIDHAVDLRLAKQRIGDKACLIGNIDPVSTMLQGSVSEVEAAARSCLDAAARSGGYILGTGCEVPQDTPLENLQALIRIGRAHDNYGHAREERDPE